MTTIPKALPPGVDQRAAAEALASATEATVKALGWHYQLRKTIAAAVVNLTAA
ncbi:hypothetical protein [Bradyrhizobium elkanii]|uniref:hypothetical protein n=1 Tax=Bradyrhizobium elkanii TaxID=29448 RepID=UPI00271504D9|nr:hypothetical protein [Bradyrhizobium elkanii]WLB77154.1 hypothetical protein QIH83_22335 [Bradyrhizobium elkanii]